MTVFFIPAAWKLRGADHGLWFKTKSCFHFWKKQPINQLYMKPFHVFVECMLVFLSILYTFTGNILALRQVLTWVREKWIHIRTLRLLMGQLESPFSSFSNHMTDFMMGSSYLLEGRTSCSDLGKRRRISNFLDPSVNLTWSKHLMHNIYVSWVLSLLGQEVFVAGLLLRGWVGTYVHGYLGIRVHDQTSLGFKAEESPRHQFLVTGRHAI